jgi:hypothetical protein
MKAYCIEIYAPVITWVQVFATDEDAALKVAAAALNEGDPSVLQLAHDGVADAVIDRGTCDTVIECEVSEFNPHIPTYEVSGDGYQEVDDERYNELSALVD